MRLSLLFSVFAVSFIGASYAMDEDVPSDELVDVEEMEPVYPLHSSKKGGVPTHNIYDVLDGLAERQDKEAAEKARRVKQRAKNAQRKKKQRARKAAEKNAAAERRERPEEVTRQFHKEAFKLAFAVVPYKMSMWAVSEVFPQLTLSETMNQTMRVLEHPTVKGALEHPTVKGVFEHTLMREITTVASSKLATDILMGIFAGITVLLVIARVSLFGLLAKVIYAVRRTMFAVSFGLLFASLSDMLLDAVAVKASANAREMISAAEHFIEMGVFALAVMISFYTSFGWQVVASLAGSVFVFAMYHFYDTVGGFHTDVNKSFLKSAAAIETQQAAATVSQLSKDAVAKGKDMINEFQNSKNAKDTSNSASGTGSTAVVPPQ